MLKHLNTAVRKQHVGKALVLTEVNAPESSSLLDLFKLGERVKHVCTCIMRHLSLTPSMQGALLEHESWTTTLHTTEFVLVPPAEDSKEQKPLPYFIDGEEFEAKEMHVKLLPGALLMYTGLD